jgi:hypothetical protein
MIELNMLKQRPVIHGIPSEKDGAKLIAVVLSGILVGAICAVAVLRLISGIHSGGESTGGFTNVADESTAPSAVVTGELKDSVSGAIETSGKFTAYGDMSMIERINYEHHYAYYLFREFSLIIPPEVDFNEVSFTHYQNVLASGGVERESGVLSLFSSLKAGGWTLKPKPASRFRLVDGEYQFVFDGIFQMKPTDLDSRIIRDSDIPSPEHLTRMKDSVTAVIKRSPVVSSGNMDLLDTEFEGKYRHYTYTVSGKSSFVQFREYLSALRLLKLPISVSDAELKAYEGGLKWRTTIKITVM